jgi:hypothetical protein
MMTGTRDADARRLVGKLLALSGLVVLAAAFAAWMRWLPYAEGTVDALAKVLAVGGGLEVMLGAYFMTRTN